MHRPSPEDPASADASPEALQRAFRELHAPSLHGFALLLTLGDRRRALALSAEALAAADAHAAELRHPERAAAWLRSRVVAAAGGRDSRIDAEARLDALGPLGVATSVLAGLAALGRLERAALIGSGIERLDDRDVATIVGRSGNRLDALLRRARRGFLEGSAAAPVGPSGLGGPLTDLVRASAARAMA
jgi:DNA-directed RNA polymerase specialized sigma24 family protein